MKYFLPGTYILLKILLLKYLILRISFLIMFCYKWIIKIISIRLYARKEIYIVRINIEIVTIC